MYDLNLTGQRLREAIKGPAALQERGPSERSSLYHEALERGEHAEEHKESTRCMITEATRLLYQKLRLPAALSSRHFSSGIVFQTTVFVTRARRSKNLCWRTKCDPRQSGFLLVRDELMDHACPRKALCQKAARKLPSNLKSPNNNR